MLKNLTILILVWISPVVVTAQPDGENYDDYTDSLDGESPPIDSTTLRLVHAVFRHGDRSPIRAYKNDKYVESDWPQGFGQLSTNGMQQEYQLGQYLKQEYVDTGFMNARYTRQQIYVRSTNYDRTLMSAYSLLAGLFPPTGDQVWNKEYIPQWQPIPVHTVPTDEDFLLGNAECPKYTEYWQNHGKDNIVRKNTVSDNWDLYQYMSENAGEEPTWDGMGQVLDPLFCQFVSNKEMPEWVMVNDTFERLIGLIDSYARMGVPPAAAYLKGGLLVGEMIEHMKNKTATVDSQQKMYLYSAHDSTVITFLSTMGVFNDRQPHYTACVIVELHEPTKGDYYVQILYKNESVLYREPYEMAENREPYEMAENREPYILKLNGCDSLCPLETFHQIMKSSIPTDIKKECGLESSTVLSKEATVAVAVLSSLVLLMVVVGSILCCMMKKNLRDSHKYSPVPMEMT